MLVNVKNLGNIKQGSFDISKRLTLFCGPNNTGKTYVSYVVYALLKLRRFFGSQDLPDLSNLISSGSDSFEINRNSLLRYRKDKLVLFKSNIESVFGLSETDNKSLFSDLEVSFSLSDNEFYKRSISADLDFVLGWDGFDIAVSKAQESSIVKLQIVNMKKASDTDSFFLAMELIGGIYERLISFPYSNACIFPVERNSIYTFNKELSIQRNELIEQMQALKENKRLGYDSIDRLLGRSTRYPLAIRDCLSVANDLTNLQKRKSDFGPFAEELEKRLLKGKVQVSKNGDVQFMPNAGKKLPVQLSASIVKTLSSLTFYLKHIAKKGDLIIIDEPEMNLHPDAQILLVRIFARLMNAGLNLLISTHSDYIVRELNSMVSLGSIKDNNALLGELEYQQSECLNAQDISVYLFKPIRKNSKVTQVVPVPVREDGFSVETIDNVINETNDRLDRISYSMRYER